MDYLRISHLERVEAAVEKFLLMMELDWQRHGNAGYSFPKYRALVLSKSEGLKIEDFLDWVEKQNTPDNGDNDGDID